MNFYEQQIILGYKMICLSLFLFTCDFMFFPFFELFYIKYYIPKPHSDNYLRYLSIQPMPLILFCTGCITVLGIILVIAGHRKKTKNKM